MLCEERRRLMDEWDTHKSEWERLAIELRQVWDSSCGIPDTIFAAANEAESNKTKLTMHTGITS
jgi:hypothetical protein